MEYYTDIVIECQRNVKARMLWVNIRALLKEGKNLRDNSNVNMQIIPVYQLYCNIQFSYVDNVNN